MTGLRRAILTWVALVSSACAVTPEVVTPRTPPPRADRPVYQLGDKWIRHDGIFEVTRVLDDRYVFTTNGDRVVHLSKDLVPFGWGRRGGEHGILDWNFGRPPGLPWPLEVGARGSERITRFFWEWRAPDWVERVQRQSRSLSAPTWMIAPGPGSYVPRQYKPVIQPEDLEWVVEAYEDVRVPGGTFKAFRLLFRGTPTKFTPGEKPSPAWWLRTWYAPEVQQLVKAEGRDVGPLAFQVVAVDREIPAPLQIAVEEPKDQGKVLVPGTLVTGRVTAGKGIARVTVTLNGQEVYRREDPEPAKKLPLDVRLQLQDGKNVVLVTATDTAGETRQEARTVFYDAWARRDAADRARHEAVVARETAVQADAERLAPAPWEAAVRGEREAEERFGAQDWETAETWFEKARETYEAAAREADRATRLARQMADTRRPQEQAGEARRAAEVVDAPRLAGPSWTRAATAQREADAALGRDDFERAQALFRDAERAYREAEREATQRATATAAAERARLAALKRQLEAAEQIAAAAAAARREAEQAGAPRHAPPLWSTAQAKEQEARTALDRQDFATAQPRFREAEQAYQRATQAAQAEAARLAALQRQQAVADEAREQAARARRAADATAADRHAPARLAAARATEREAQAALARQDYSGARQRFADATAAYEQATREARVAALPPLQLTLASPRDQARFEQETTTLAATLTSARGLTRVVVTLDAVEVARVEPPSPQRALPLDVPLRLREGQNTLVLTATEADGTLAQEVRTLYYEKPVPLTVAVRYPEDRARLTDEATVLAALVTSSRGIARVAVTLNGVEVHQQSERGPTKSVAIAVPVTLRAGANALVVTASERDGAVRQELRTVVYDAPKAAPPAPTPPPPPEPQRWAVIVGVGRYESPDIPRLRYTVSDAEALYQLLVGSAGFKKENVLLLTDQTDRKPTLRHLKWALGTFLARSARKDDTVLIFFAGHGAPEVDQRGLERDGLTKYLVPSDADADDLYATALPMDELRTIFDRIEAERVVAFLDTCYSGAAGGRTFAARKTRAGQLDDGFLERLARAKGRAIITAARPAEVSIELPELGHGLFTYYLVQGLQGAADANRDGIVDLQELYQYLEREVTRRSRAVGANQHPVMKGELEGILPLVKVGSR
jgi:hypothetical protein